MPIGDVQGANNSDMKRCLDDDEFVINYEKKMKVVVEDDGESRLLEHV